MNDSEAKQRVLVDTDRGDFIEKKTGKWRPIKSAPRDGTIIDVWLEIYASPRSFGMGDSFGVPDAWFADGGWVHMYCGKPAELYGDYVRYWRPKAK